MPDLSDMLFKQWEKMFTAFMEQLTRNKAFLGHMGKVMESSNLFKMTVDKAMLKALESAQMPTRKDLEETLTAVRTVESGVVRTQQRLAEMEGKLDAVAGAMATLLTRLEAASGSVPVKDRQAPGKSAGKAKTTPKKKTGTKKTA